MTEFLSDIKSFRFHVSNLPQNEMVKDNLIKIFSKLCSVQEIHIPSETITGILRNFAIVRVSSTDELKEKCLKVFNGCFLLDHKIRVELCKNTYYKEKLALEYDSYLKSKEDLELKIRKSHEVEIPMYNAPKSKSHKIYDDNYVVIEGSPDHTEMEDVHVKDKISIIPAIDSKMDMNSDSEDDSSVDSAEGVPADISSILLVDSTISIEEKSRSLTILSILLKDANINQKVERKQNTTTTSSNPIVMRYDPKKSRDKRVADASVAIVSHEAVTIAFSQDVPQHVVPVQAEITSEPHDELQFADLRQFKEIFGREEGVWFGDNGKVQIIRGDTADDQMFLEAEKYGFDIRTQNKESTGVSFSFFEPEVIQIEESNNMCADSVRSSIVASAPASESKVNRLNPLTVSEILSFAIKFRREKPEADVRKDWADTKEGLSQSIKLKRRQSIKGTNKRKKPN